MSSPAVLMVDGKRTWLAVLNGSLNPRLSLSTEFNPPLWYNLEGEETGIEVEMGRWRDAGRIDAGTIQRELLI